METLENWFNFVKVNPVVVETGSDSVEKETEIPEEDWSCEHMAMWW